MPFLEVHVLNTWSQMKVLFGGGFGNFRMYIKLKVISEGFFGIEWKIYFPPCLLSCPPWSTEVPLLCIPVLPKHKKPNNHELELSKTMSQNKSFFSLGKFPQVLIAVIRKLTASLADMHRIRFKCPDQRSPGSQILSRLLPSTPCILVYKPTRQENVWR